MVPSKQTPFHACPVPWARGTSAGLCFQPPRSRAAGPAGTPRFPPSPHGLLGFHNLFHEGTSHPLKTCIWISSKIISFRSRMLFVHLMLVIKDQSCPSISGRRQVTENSRRQVTDRTPRGGWEHLQAECSPTRPPPGWEQAIPLEQGIGGSGLLTCADAHTEPVYMHVFKGKYFWNKHHYNKSALCHARLNGGFRYRIN